MANDEADIRKAIRDIVGKEPAPKKKSSGSLPKIGLVVGIGLAGTFGLSYLYSQLSESTPPPATSTPYYEPAGVDCGIIYDQQREQLTPDPTVEQLNIYYDGLKRCGVQSPWEIESYVLSMEDLAKLNKKLYAGIVFVNLADGSLTIHVIGNQIGNQNEQQEQLFTFGNGKNLVEYLQTEHHGGVPGKELSAEPTKLIWFYAVDVDDSRIKSIETTKLRDAFLENHIARQYGYDQAFGPGNTFHPKVLTINP